MRQGPDRFVSLQSHLERMLKLAGGQALSDARQLYFQTLDQVEAARAGTETPLVSFANYDYLGLSRHPEVEQAGIDALRTFGSGALASRLVGGERSIHQTLEASLARFTGTEDAMALVSGYLANQTVISTILTGRDLVLYDEWSHASIQAGLRASRARSIAVRHNDLDHLRALLEAHRKDHPNCLIVVEGLYSMEGDAPDLAGLLALKDEFGAWLMIDEAHSHGVLGATGRGLCEYAGQDPARIELTVGTLSKSFASCGGFVAGKRAVIDILRMGLPGFVFSVGIPPVVAATAEAAVRLAEREPWRVETLARKSARMLQRAKEAGLNTAAAAGYGIVPVLFATQQQTVEAAIRLFQNGVYAPPIVQSGVPTNLPRVRFFISAVHKDADIDRAVDVLADYQHGLQSAAHA